MISLARRPERRNRMLACLDELGFDYTLVDAVDGRYIYLTIYTMTASVIMIYIPHDTVGS